MTKGLSALLQGAEGYEHGANGTTAAKLLPTYKALRAVCVPGGISLHCVVWVAVTVTSSRLGDGTSLALQKCWF